MPKHRSTTTKVETNVTQRIIVEVKEPTFVEVGILYPRNVESKDVDAVDLDEFFKLLADVPAYPLLKTLWMLPDAPAEPTSPVPDFTTTVSASGA
jgi:hypothetical protein